MDLKRSTILLSILAAIAVCAVAAGGWLVIDKLADTYLDSYLQLRETQITTAAASVNYKDVESLEGGPADLQNPAYKELRALLARIKGSDYHVRSVYLLKKDNSELVYLVDSEEPSSHAFAPPGRVYEGSTSDITDVLDGEEKPDPVVENPTGDHNGKIISATAYISDGKGNPIAAIRTDMDERTGLSTYYGIRNWGLILDIVVSVLLAIVATQFIVWRYNKERHEVVLEEMQESALQLSKELIKADRLKSEFLELASHELRGPVNAIYIAMQAIDKQIEERLSDDEIELMEVASNGSKRLVDLIDNLLDLTRIEVGDFSFNPEEVDLGNIAAQTVKLFEPLAVKRGLELELEGPNGDLKAFLDRHAILRVLENLVSNAIKFTDTGQIDVRLDVGEDTVGFTVTDTGTGIPEDLKNQVFGKFAKLHPPSEDRVRGSGMGLALCKGIVEAQGGRIWFDSEEGKGSSFHFRVPRFQKSDADEKTGDAGE